MEQPIHSIRPPHIDPQRLSLYRRAIWIALLGNGVLALLKGVAAWLSGSTAVLATAVDSFTDLVYTLFMAWGLWHSQQPADESHPQGHTRIEPLVSAIIALMMGIAGLEVVRRSTSRLLGEPATFSWGMPAAILIGSALIKVIMYLMVRRVARSARSPAIAASAQDNLTDVISSGTALAGVLIAGWLHPLADPLAGLAVSIWIFRNAATILVENLGYLTGRAAEPELLERICAAARGVEGVMDVHQVVADYVGPQVRADLHVDVDGRTPFLVAHEISDAVRDAVEALNEVDLAYVHVEPAELHPRAHS
ncbi:MAG TPA: cation diffusion facilitator family transporter [Anaerolineae bacterium]|nr:cation diffusion facilitator family transporter [Anaerolineae bacterium]